MINIYVYHSIITVIAVFIAPIDLPPRSCTSSKASHAVCSDSSSPPESSF